MAFPFDAICAIGWRVIGVGGAVARPRDERQKDLLRPALEAIIDLSHPLVRLTREIDWEFLDRHFARVCARWLGNSYYQFFCGELSFCHKLPFDRSSLTHWRQRLGASSCWC